jgi:hypothetical protein
VAAGGGSAGNIASAGTAGQGGAGASACNDLDNLGMDVKDKSAPGAFPSLGPQGTPVNGTYVLTSAVAYDGNASSYTRKRTLLIDGGKLQSVTSVDSGKDERASFSIDPSDLLNQTPTCGAADDEWESGLSLAYSFTPQGTLLIRQVKTTGSATPRWPNRLDTYTRVQ